MFSNMNTIQKIFVTTVALLVLLTLAITIFASPYNYFSDNIHRTSERIDVNTEKDFNSNGTDLIKVRTVSENINIISSDSDEIKVVFYGESSDSRSAPQLIAEQNGSTLNISVQHPKSIFTVFDIAQKYILDVHIPTGYRGSVECNTVSADIATPEMDLKNLKCGTVSGSLKTKGSYQDFKFESVSGVLRSDLLNTEEAYFHSTSGSMSVSSFKGDLDFSSTSGNLDVLYSDFNNNISISSVSGDSKIGLPKNSQFYLNLKSTSGNITTDFPVTVKKTGNNKLEGVVASDKNSITGTSVSGDFLIYEQDS